jgi:Caspase domain
MRSATWTMWAGVALTGLWISAPPGRGGETSLAQGTIQLELPELGAQRFAPGVLRVLEPEKIRRLVLHIPLTKVFKTYPKINTVAVGPAQRVWARQDEVICDIDLAVNRARSYDLGAEDNTVEIKVLPQPKADPLYAKWVIAPPKEGQVWETHTRLASGAALGAEGVVVLEELEDGRLSRLEKGITTARRVFLQARFARREESVALRVHWSGEQGEERTFSAGAWSGGTGEQPRGRRGKAAAAEGPPTLEGEVELRLGQNRLDVEVMHGYTTLSRSTYRIVRRAPSTPSAVVGEKWAVVIGISRYRVEGLDLRYADRDAEAIRDFLLKQGGFSPDHVRFLSNQQATHDEIRAALFTFLAATQPDDLALIFLAGHGVQDAVNPDNFFFLAHDSQLGNLGATAIPMWDLGNVMDFTIRAQRILVMADTCHSGAALDRGGPQGGENLNFFNKYLENLARKKGRLVLTASQAHESSLETAQLAHGAFTQAVLLGLAGAADNNPADGVVTAGELIDYVRSKVPEVTQGEQHPSFLAQGFDLNFPLAYARRSKTSRQ